MKRGQNIPLGIRVSTSSNFFCLASALALFCCSASGGGASQSKQGDGRFRFPAPLSARQIRGPIVSRSPTGAAQSLAKAFLSCQATGPARQIRCSVGGRACGRTALILGLNREELRAEGVIVIGICLGGGFYRETAVFWGDQPARLRSWLAGGQGVRRRLARRAPMSLTTGARDLP